MIEAPARVFHSQEELHAAFRAGELDRDFVAVVRFQGPKAPTACRSCTSSCRRSACCRIAAGASRLSPTGACPAPPGKVPAAIHVTPEAAAGGAIAKIRDGDMIRLDAANGRLEVDVASEDWTNRVPAAIDLSAAHVGVGRELFGAFRAFVGAADEGAAIFPAA